MRIKANVLFEKIDAEIKSGKRYVSLRGSSRSGKTVCALQTVVLECLINPNTTVTIARETQVSIKNTILLDFKEVLEQLQMWEDSRFNKVDQVYRFSNGSVIRFIGLDNDASGKLRGMKSTICVIDEVNTISKNSFIQLDIRTEKYILMCYNPEIPTDWWGLDYETKTNGCVLVSTWRDNVFLEQSSK